MTQPNISGKGLLALVLIALVCLSPFVSGALAMEFHDVKYFFDNLETFRNDITRSGITEKVAVRGRVVTYMLPVRCVKGPCPPVKGIFFQDVDDENYRFPIFGGNNLLRRLKIGNVYVLDGMLEQAARHSFGADYLYFRLPVQYPLGTPFSMQALNASS